MSPDRSRRRAALRAAMAAVAVFALAAGALPPISADPEQPADEPRSPEAEAVAEARRIIGVARKTEERYRSSGPFRVSFEQGYASSTFQFEEENAGTIHVVPPRRMLWVYDVPEGQRAVLDGDTWWLVEPELRQVSRRDRRPGEADPLVDMLSGRLELLSFFSARPSVEPAEEEGQVVVELIPRTARDDMDLAIVWIDAATGDMRRVDVIDPLGNRMTFRFGRPVAEDPPPEGAFRVSVPSGYTLVRE